MLPPRPPLRSMLIRRSHPVPYAITQASSSSKAVCSEPLQDQGRQNPQTQPMRRLLHTRLLRETSRQKTALKRVISRVTLQSPPSRVRALQGPQTQARILQACLHLPPQQEAAQQGSSKQQPQEALRGRPTPKHLHLDSLCPLQKLMLPRSISPGCSKGRGARMTPWASSRSLLVRVPRARKEIMGKGVLQPSMLRQLLMPQLLSNAQGTELLTRSTHPAWL